jgi:hypothetical protein
VPSLGSGLEPGPALCQFRRLLQHPPLLGRRGWQRAGILESPEQRGPVAEQMEQPGGDERLHLARGTANRIAGARTGSGHKRA